MSKRSVGVAENEQCELFRRSLISNEIYIKLANIEPEVFESVREASLNHISVINEALKPINSQLDKPKILEMFSSGLTNVWKMTSQKRNELRTFFTTDTPEVTVDVLSKIKEVKTKILPIAIDSSAETIETTKLSSARLFNALRPTNQLASVRFNPYAVQTEDEELILYNNAIKWDE